MTASFLNSCSRLIRSFVEPKMAPPPDHDPMDVDEEEPVKNGLFAQSSFIVVRGPGLNDDMADQVSTLLSFRNIR